jgi:lycopene beta-cyclase
MSKYDFIVTGAGAAGRSFVYQLLVSSSLRDSRVLLIDRERKTADDRTWSFWEDRPGPFEEIVHHRWNEWWFYQGDYERKINMAPFTYKMVRAADYYRYTDACFADFPNVEVLKTEVKDWEQDANEVCVHTRAGTFTADWCINSIWRGTIDKDKVNYLDQHFRGWFIETEEPVFDPSIAIPMDFRTPQKGETRFLYVLPDSPTTALVEVAIFSNAHQDAAGYDTIMANYLRDYWPQIKHYRIQRTEEGVIPMTDYRFTPREGRIIHLGTAGGDTRASSGYTFLYIHRRVARLIKALEGSGQPPASEPWIVTRHREYDRLLLHVLQHGLYPGDELFQQLFARNNPQRLFRFLNGETSVTEELKVMAASPIRAFLSALGREVVGKH